ncbi:MAG: hypothetical protein LBK27_08475 [Treponema sp.]|jgi:hypothetical protein|nr:hypothetical protein [Treponema sp.]
MKHPKVRMSVSLPIALMIRIENINADRLNKGHTALETNTFMSELIALGLETWEERHSKKYVSGINLGKFFKEIDQGMFPELSIRKKPLLKIVK